MELVDGSVVEGGGEGDDLGDVAVEGVCGGRGLGEVEALPGPERGAEAAERAADDDARRVELEADLAAVADADDEQRPALGRDAAARDDGDGAPGEDAEVPCAVDADVEAVRLVRGVRRQQRVDVRERRRAEQHRDRERPVRARHRRDEVPVAQRSQKPRATPRAGSGRGGAPGRAVVERDDGDAAQERRGRRARAERRAALRRVACGRRVPGQRGRRVRPVRDAPAAVALEALPCRKPHKHALWAQHWPCRSRRRPSNSRHPCCRYPL